MLLKNSGNSFVTLLTASLDPPRNSPKPIINRKPVSKERMQCRWQAKLPVLWLRPAVGRGLSGFRASNVWGLGLGLRAQDLVASVPMG